MSYCLYRVIYNHSWPRPAHNITNLLTHLGLVAMYWALFAGALLLAKLATIEALVGIGDKFSVLFTRGVEVQLVTTI